MGLLEIVQRFDRLVVRRIDRVKSMFCAFKKMKMMLTDTMDIYYILYYGNVAADPTLEDVYIKLL